VLIGITGLPHTAMAASIRRRLRSGVVLEDYRDLDAAQLAAKARGRGDVLIEYHDPDRQAGLGVMAVAPRVVLLVGGPPSTNWSHRCEQVGLAWRYGGRSLDPSDYGCVVMDRVLVTCRATVPVTEPVAVLGPLSDGGKAYWSYADRFADLGMVVSTDGSPAAAHEALARYLDGAMMGDHALPFRPGSAGVVPTVPFQLEVEDQVLTGAVMHGPGPRQWRILGVADVATLLGYPDVALDSGLEWDLVAALPGVELFVAIIHATVEALQHADNDLQGSPSGGSPT